MQKGGTFSKQNMFLLIGVAVVCGGGFFSLLYFDVVKLPMVSVAPTPTPSPVPTSTPAPVPSFDKAAASVVVLNGTGTPGQAGDVKTTLEGLGFSDIDTENAEENTTDTLVVFSSNVPKSIQDEIVSTLEKTFATVSESVDEKASTDITITTGEEK